MLEIITFIMTQLLWIFCVAYSVIEMDICQPKFERFLKKVLSYQTYMPKAVTYKGHKIIVELHDFHNADSYENYTYFESRYSIYFNDKPAIFIHKFNGKINYIIANGRLLGEVNDILKIFVKEAKRDQKNDRRYHETYYNSFIDKGE